MSAFVQSAASFKMSTKRLVLRCIGVKCGLGAENEEKRESPEQSPKRSVSRVSALSRLIYVKERQTTGSPDSVLSTRLRQRRRRIVMSDEDGCSKSPTESNADSRCSSSLSVPSLPLLGRGTSPSARTTRSLPVTPTVPATELDVQERQKKVEEETRAILHNMNTRESQAEVERERQQERLERLRRQKRFLAEDRTQKALQLLEKALEMDKVLVQDKERQGLQLRNKLDEMKKKRGQHSVEYVEIIELQEK